MGVARALTAFLCQDSLLRKLPVLIVDDWDEITLELLQRAYVDLDKEHRVASVSGAHEGLQGPGRYEHAELFADYWRRALHSHAAHAA